jgi:regulatory protein
MAETFLFNTALNKAMALCASREICKWDIRQKLNMWGIKGDEAERIISRLSAEKFIDEERFTSAFVKDKFKYNKWGKIKTGAALKAKRIPEEIIRRALDSIDDEEYIDLLKVIIEKQKKTIRAKNQYDLKGKLLRHCLARGFESHLIYDLLKIDE